MKPQWQELASLAQEICTLGPVERLPALHYSVDFIVLSFGIMGFIVEI